MTITTTAYSITDDFTTNTSASYTSTANDGGSPGTWTFDTANLRLLGSAGNDASLIYTGLSYLNGYTEIQTDQMRGGSLIFRFPNNNNLFACYVGDSGHSTTNQIQVYWINGGGYNLLGTAAIAFTTGTLHTIRLTVCHRSIALSFDGTIIAAFAVSGDTSAGSGGVGSGSASNHFQKLTIRNL